MIVTMQSWPMADDELSIALCDWFPEFVGHGDDGDDATDDLVVQLEAITWH